MFVVKRDGHKEPIMFDKITKAYMTLLEQLKNNSGNQSFYDLKKQSKNKHDFVFFVLG